MLFKMRDASDEFWWKLMTHEALYYAFYYVTVWYTLPPGLKLSRVIWVTRSRFIWVKQVRLTQISRFDPDSVLYYMC